MIDVLVVDDDFMVSRIHRGFVERVPGFRVVGTAHTGQEALDAAAELRPDLVLLDLYLPDIFGLDVVTRLRTAGLECDVLVISAARESDAVRGAVRHGVVNYLLKPFGFDDLRRRLEQYAAQRSGMYAAEVHSQADVDRVLARAPRGRPPRPCPKGSARSPPGWSRALCGPRTRRCPPLSARKRSGSLGSVHAGTSSTCTTPARRTSRCGTRCRGAPSAGTAGSVKWLARVGARRAAGSRAPRSPPARRRAATRWRATSQYP
jgi:response regulator of citrate/malate metabolism